MRTYFYSLLRKYLSLFILPQNSVVEIDPTSSLLVGALPQGKVTFRHSSEEKALATDFLEGTVLPVEAVYHLRPDYLVISGLIHYDRDIQGLLARLHKMCHRETRLVLTYYSSLWRPFASLASNLGLRRKLPESNWLAHEDVKNLLELENFELIRLDHKILLPFFIPIVSNFFNRYLAPLPFFRNFCLLNIALARPLFGEVSNNLAAPSVSIIVPARNEAGNIDNIVMRIPVMGPDDEIIFIEGNSTDDTWQAIQAAKERFGSE